LTGTAAEVTPVRSVDRLEIGCGSRGPITETIQSAFFGLFDGTTEDEWNWLDSVEP
jgi:branched-chain amino acid aminotransferase